MSGGPLRWGAFVPQGWKLEYTGVGAAEAWARSKEIALEAERLGYDHLWVYDHMETVPRREPTQIAVIGQCADDGIADAWTVAREVGR